MGRDQARDAGHPEGGLERAQRRRLGLLERGKVGWLRLLRRLQGSHRRDRRRDRRHRAVRTHEPGGRVEHGHVAPVRVGREERRLGAGHELGLQRTHRRARGHRPNRRDRGQRLRHVRRQPAAAADAHHGAHGRLLAVRRRHAHRGARRGRQRDGQGRHRHRVLRGRAQLDKHVGRDVRRLDGRQRCRPGRMVRVDRRRDEQGGRVQRRARGVLDRGGAPEARTPGPQRRVR